MADQMEPFAQPPPPPGRSTRHSVETLVVVLAAITIIGVFAGIVARLCGGRHLGGSGEQDIEGWVEKKCRSCIDGGVAEDPPQAPPAPAKDEKPKPAAAEEEKK